MHQQTQLNLGRHFDIPRTQWDDATLWRTYTMLTDLEAVFRSLKAELGLRPIFHHKTNRVSAHLFISVLAYHLVHTFRFQLKAKGIHLSWSTTRAEPRQKVICDALGIAANPGKTEQTIIV